MLSWSTIIGGAWITYSPSAPCGSLLTNSIHLRTPNELMRSIWPRSSTDVTQRSARGRLRRERLVDRAASLACVTEPHAQLGNGAVGTLVSTS